MKAFTDIEQSKKLASILPLDSADMYYGNADVYKITIGKWNNEKHDEDDIPCWSLAALIDLIQDDIRIEKHLFDQSDMFTHSIISDTFKIRTYEHDELIDACVEMILKLKDMNLL